jgi:hypothetical protein
MKRIQRSRAKGWKMPENAVYVGRPSKYGNPFVMYDWQAAFRAVLLLGEMGDRAGMGRAAVKLYRAWLTCDRTPAKDPGYDEFWQQVAIIKVDRKAPTIEEIHAELGGKDLACWCPLRDKSGNPIPCHADVLLEIANS